jgi:hypothetical protein
MRTIFAFLVVSLLGFQSIRTQFNNNPQSTEDPGSVQAVAAGDFRFISWSDAQDEDTNLADSAAQAASLNPDFTIFNGDLENEGVDPVRMDVMTNAFGALNPKTFLVRGNHDDHVSGSEGIWENYFTTASRPLPAGAANYVGLSASTTYLTYSFDYANARFIGIDVPGDADLLTSAQLTFLDSRLTDAEIRGLTHAFIFFHGPEYCVESTHCGCSQANDGSCTPSGLVSVINQHPIVSATFHGHEHIMGWTHMSSSRVAGLTHEYEEFLTSPSGGWTYSSYIYPARMDYYYANMGSSQGFASIDVSGTSFTVNYYKTGATSPVWSKSFTKVGAVPPADNPTATYTSTKTFQPTATAESTLKGPPDPSHFLIYLPMIRRSISMPGSTPIPTKTATQTSVSRTTATRTRRATRTPTSAPSKTPTRTTISAVSKTPTKVTSKTPTSAVSKTPTLQTGSRPLKYYAVDRVLNNTDYAKLAAWGVDTAVVSMGINSSSSWNSVITAAANAGINIVIWPDQGGDVSGCGWEIPFNSPQNGDYIYRVKGMLDALGNNPHVIGMVIAHEPEWNQGTCRTSIADMAAVKTQIKNYVQTKFGRTDFLIWNYIDNISDISSINDYSGPADYDRIMDVAVTWQHCAGDAESTCDTGSYSALAKINNDRKLLQNAGSKAELVFLQDTFTMSGGYETKFNLSQFQTYSCEFLNTNALDGFAYYTWNAGWWPDLHSWTDLQPGVPYIYNNCAQPAP